MGGGNSKLITVKGGKKKVVVVGGSFGGKQLVQQLQGLDPKEEQFEILIVDKQKHFEFICSNYKVLCEEETFKKHAVDFESGIKNGYKSNRISYQQGKLVNVYPQENAIEVENDQGEKSKISYDALVLVTGASMVGPWRAEDDTMKTMEERDADVKEFREKLKAANSILCIGAGATGCESACYLKDTWPDKKIGICQRGNVMMPDIPGAHELIKNYLEEIKVTYHHDTAFREGEGVALEYEQHIDCRGFRYDGPRKYLGQGEMSDCIDGKTGQIWVNKFCQVTNKHPIATNHNPSGEVKTYNNIFSLGDVCLTPANEIKSIVSIYQYSDKVAINVQQVLAAGPDVSQSIKTLIGPSLVAIPSGPDFHNLCFIPLGKNGGVMAINGFVKFDKSVPSEKDKIANKTMGFFNGDPKSIKEDYGTQKEMQGMMGFFSGCCVCLPVHINKVKSKNVEKFNKNKAMFEKLY